MNDKANPAWLRLWLRLRWEYGAFRAECAWSGAPWWRRNVLYAACYVAYCSVVGAACSLVCRLRGHAWVDAGSYAGPESAHDALRCTRCGAEFDYTYY